MRSPLTVGSLFWFLIKVLAEFEGGCPGITGCCWEDDPSCGSTHLKPQIEA